MTRAILNQGGGSWAFEDHAFRLRSALWVEITSIPHELNYLLCWEPAEIPPGQSFIPWRAIKTASDKRLQAVAFARSKVTTPETILVDTPEELRRILERETGREWVLKYPIGCGGTGHRSVSAATRIPEDWPRPFVLQEFIHMKRPEVYRVYGVGGEIFGWNARRFPEGVKGSPWVAHARGARYVHFDRPPAAAVTEARAALDATDLLDSFGAVDLLRRQEEWLVLEVGTDGVFNHVDRDFENPALELELNRKLAEAFWAGSEDKPWGSFGWKPMSQVAAIA